MSALARAARWLLFVLILWAGAAQAHLMVAQNGTVNIKGASAYLMLSLPVSAFKGFDDDSDGLLNMQELQRYAPQLQEQFEASAQLLANGHPTPFELLLLNLSAPDDRPDGPASQLLVMGRYLLGDGLVATGGDLHFSIRLFGTNPTEGSINLAFTRADRTQVLLFSPEVPERALFQSGFSLLTQQVRSGAKHVLGGADHLLFLLVVLAEALATRCTWRRGLALITAFTIGHGLTLAGTATGWFSLSPAVVEPTIAASIIFMALSTLRRLHRRVSMPFASQVLLVFTCALIHGLGLGDALRSQGWRSDELPWALAGFNLGVELAQIIFGSGCMLLLLASQRLVGRRANLALAYIASVSGAFLGVWWLLERTAVLS